MHEDHPDNVPAAIFRVIQLTTSAEAGPIETVLEGRQPMEDEILPIATLGERIFTRTQTQTNINRAGEICREVVIYRETEVLQCGFAISHNGILVDASTLPALGGIPDTGDVVRTMDGEMFTVAFVDDNGMVHPMGHPPRDAAAVNTVERIVSVTEQTRHGMLLTMASEPGNDFRSVYARARLEAESEITFDPDAPLTTETKQ